MKKYGRPKKKHRILRFFFRFFLLAFILCLLGAGGLIGWAVYTSPSIDEVDVTPSGFRTEILDDQGKGIRILAGEGANRVYVTMDRIPENLQHAFVAIEDERFYDHFGIDIIGIARAAYKGVKNGFHFSEGASTITQQLLKNNVLTSWTDEQTFQDKLKRKLQEQYLAVLLERRMTKNEILENYLNTINLGSGCWGVQAASMQYFGKEVSDLNLAECALLAGITKNPSSYSPLKDEESCKERQHLVLYNMLEQGYIDQAAYEEAISDDVFTRIEEANAGKDQDNILSYYEDALLDAIVSDFVSQKGCTEEDAWQMIYRGGLTIYSCMDSNLQEIAEEEINDDDNYASDAQASLVLYDYQNGEVKAIVGGRGEKEASLLYDRATDSERQPGSTFKIPGEYAEALETGKITLGSTIDDAPTTYSDGSKLRNSDDTYRGMTTVREAIAQSLNIPAVKMIQEVSIESVWTRLKDFGFDSLTDDDKVESLALGGTHNGVTNLQLTAAYGAIANKGQYIEPVFYTKVVDQEGNTVLTADQDTREVLTWENALLLTSAMESVMTDGTGKKADFDGMSLAGKSGTTSSKKDLWFVGYSPYYACGVWGGYDDNKEQTESDYVKLIWKNVMERAHEGLDNTGFSGEDELDSCEICTKCGKLATEGLCDDTVEGDMTATEYFAPGTAPTEYCDCHVSIKICSESGKKAGSYCPSADIKTKVYLKTASKGTTDEDYVLPESLENSSCNVHKSFWSNWFGENDQSSQDSGSGSNSGNSNGNSNGSNGSSQSGSSNGSGNTEDSGNNEGNNTQNGQESQNGQNSQNGQSGDNSQPSQGGNSQDGGFNFFNWFTNYGR